MCGGGLCLGGDLNGDGNKAVVLDINERIQSDSTTYRWG